MTETSEASPPEVELELGRFQRIMTTGRRVGALALRIGLTAGLTIGGGTAAMKSYGSVDAELCGLLDVEAGLTTGVNGDVVLPFFGGAGSFDASDGPLGAHVTATNLDRRVGSLVQEELSATSDQESTSKATEPVLFGSGNNFLQPCKDDLVDLKNLVIAKGLVAGFGGAIAGAALAETSWALSRAMRRKEIPEHRDLIRIGARTLLWPLGLAASVGAFTIPSFDSSVFERPPVFQNDSSLAGVVDAVKQVTSSADEYVRNSERMSEWLNSILLIQRNLGNAPSAEGLVPGVLIADAHKLPCAYDQVQLIIDNFEAAFVIYAGDEEDGNLLLEPVLSSTKTCGDESLETLGVPLIVIKGNHDSWAWINEMATKEGVYVPDGKTLSVPIPTKQGTMTLRVTGMSDPRYTPDFTTRPSETEERKLLEESGRQLGLIIARDKPDLALVHSPTAGEQAAKAVDPKLLPTFIQGDIHRLKVDPKRKSITLGSLGGGGVRSYESTKGDSKDETTASQIMVAYFDPKTKQPVWGWNFATHNDGRSTAEPVYFDRSRDGSQAAADAVGK